MPVKYTYFISRMYLFYKEVQWFVSNPQPKYPSICLKLNVFLLEDDS